MLLINERIDVAAAILAHGVQLGEEALSTHSARAILGNDVLVGRSVHSVNGAKVAEREGADFLLVGTMFASSTHPGEEPSGPALVTSISSACSLPIIGIGGINESNIKPIIKNGAHGIAIISAISESKNPKITTKNIYQKLNEAWEQNED